MVELGIPLDLLCKVRSGVDGSGMRVLTFWSLLEMGGAGSNQDCQLRLGVHCRCWSIPELPIDPLVASG